MKCIAATITRLTTTQPHSVQRKKLITTAFVGAPRVVNLARFLPWQADDLVTANWLLKVLLPHNSRITLLVFVRRNLLRCNEVVGVAAATQGRGKHEEYVDGEG